VQSGNRPAAEANFLRALSYAPDFNGARLNLGRLYLENSAKDPKELVSALEAYQNVLRYESDNAEALYQSAALLEAAGSFSASLDHLKRLPREEQERAETLVVLCADFAGMNQSAQAITTADRLLKNQDLDETQIMAMLPRLEARDTALAVRILEGLLERHLANRAALTRLGWHYEQQGRLAEARDFLERAEQSGPPSVEILIALARVAYQQRDRKGTLGYLAQARDLNPRLAGVHFFFGIVCVELNLPIEARKALDEAVRLDPEKRLLQLCPRRCRRIWARSSAGCRLFREVCRASGGRPTGPVRTGRRTLLFGKR
jgi:tetratricopeptide (TPR) repeat protein